MHGARFGPIASSLLPKGCGDADADAAVAPKGGDADAAVAPKVDTWFHWDVLHENSKRDVNDACSFVSSTTHDASFFGFTGILPPRGIYYVVVDAHCESFKVDGDRFGRPCCVSIGVVDAALASLPNGHIGGGQSVGDTWMMSLMAVGLGPQRYRESSTRGAEPMRVGMMINCDTHELTVVNHDNPLVGGVRFVGLPSRVRVAIQGPKHITQVKLLPNLTMPPRLFAFKTPVVGASDGGATKPKKQKWYMQ